MTQAASLRADADGTENSWTAQVRADTARVLRMAGLFLCGGLVVGFILDSLFMPAAQLGTVRVGIALQAVVAFSTFATFSWWGWAKRNVYVVACVLGFVFAGLCGFFLGELGGMDGPYFYACYALPYAALGVEGTFWQRLWFTVALLCGFLSAFFGFHPQHLAGPMAHVAWSYVIMMTGGTLYIGKLQHERSRELFDLRLAETRRSQNLAAEKDRLSEKVEVQRNDLVAVAERIEHVRSEERRGLARILHDDVGQLLVGARVGIEDLERAAIDEENHHKLEDLRGIVERIEAATRSVLQVFREDHVPFEVAVDDLVEMFRRLDRLHIEVNLDCQHWEPGPELGRACLRTVQECLTNTMKHANASRVSVSISRAPSALTIRVCDDGGGFSKDMSGTSAGGFGLEGLRERAAALGGTVLLGAAEEGGAQVHVTFPLNSNAAHPSVSASRPTVP